MSVMLRNAGVSAVIAMVIGTLSANVAAQPQEPPEAELTATVSDTAPPTAAQMTEGPQIDGFISARSGDRMKVTAADGSSTVITITDNTQVRASGGFLGLSRSRLPATSLLNGMPVSVKTLRSGAGLYASQINLKSSDVKTAAMIHNGTDQRFTEQAAATDALRSRMGDIDQYNIKSTTNVNFDVGKAVLSSQAKNDLCATAASADAMPNALLLVVGYTDSTGSEELNQELSEKRAARVVNYLQQACRWKPYRMLTPTGMSEADPLASNDTIEGKAQNRRVSVNVMVSKGLDGL